MTHLNFFVITLISLLIMLIFPSEITLLLALPITAISVITIRQSIILLQKWI